MVYLGIDVCKAKLHACLLNAQDQCKTKVVENNPPGITLLLAWAARHGAPAAQVHAVMEATGLYHEVAAYTLFEAGVTVSIVNPAQAKDFARGLAVRTKTDGVDSHVLARFGALLKPPAWRQPPAPAIRDLQALLARREAVAQDRRREQNRREKALATVTPVRVQQSIDDAITFYDRLLARGKTKMSALGAAMRKLVHLCFGVIKTRKPDQADYAFSA